MTESLVGQKFWIVGEGLYEVEVVKDDGGDQVVAHWPAFGEHPYFRDQLLSVDDALAACRENADYWRWKVEDLEKAKGAK